MTIRLQHSRIHAADCAECETKTGRLDRIEWSLQFEGDLTFDAGIQFGEYIAQDMVAVRVSPDLRPAIVGAPAYFASHPKPTVPRDVLQHQCIGFRHRGESKYRWEFDKGGQSMAISVRVAPRR